MPTSTALSDLELRPLQSADDYAACVDLQEATWGQGFADRVPASLLMIAQKVGGIAAGAFAPDGTLSGFVLGFTGIRRGTPAHWSHMLAVREDSRDRGIGRALKLYQRERLLQSGVIVMYWTFDPLVARNAQLNINELGAIVEEYVPNLYGPGDDSPLDRGIGTDRFIVRWDLTEADRSSGRRARAVERGTAQSVPQNRNAIAARVEIPPDIHALKSVAPETAGQWRQRTRTAFLDYQGKGYHVVGFDRAPGGHGGAYLLERSG